MRVAIAQINTTVGDLSDNTNKILEAYNKGGRQELADREAEGIEIIQRFLPEQLGDEEMTAAVSSAIETVGAESLKEMGAVGVVADGFVLTAEVIRKREGIPVFCRGTVSLSRGTDHPGWINTPAICGGVIVNPGDLILGDEDGVVVVPKTHAEEIISLVEGRGNGREKPGRPRDGNIPAREPLDDPYYKRSGAEAKLDAMSDITIR